MENDELLRMMEEIALDVGVTLRIEVLDDGEIVTEAGGDSMEQIHEFERRVRALDVVDSGRHSVIRAGGENTH